ncbi:sialin [Tribolium castaneum]|uniref:sialin n=1 Tax=Tribolium castaneum TaxID=7070 RepID=UPI0030FEA127
MSISTRTSDLSSPAASRTSDLLENKYSKYFLFPQRYIFCLLASLIILNAASIQFTLEVIALENFSSGKRLRTNDTCTITPQIRRRPRRRPKNESLLNYDWNLKTRYLIKDSFYWGTLVTSIPGGVLSDEYGGKYIVSLSVLFSAFFNLVAPAIIDLGHSVGLIIMIRVGLGFCRGVLDAGLMALIARWAPVYERATITSVIFGSRLLGEQFSYVMHKAFENFTWRPMFYFFASVHLVLGFFWHLLVYPSPKQNPFMTLNEKRYLEEDPDLSLVDGWKKIPWRRILKSKPVWGLCCLHFATTWAWTVYRKTLHLYLPRVLKSEVVWESAWWTPFFLYYILAIFYGFVADWFVNGQHASVTAMRKVYALLGNFGPALCLIFVTFERCNHFTVMIFTTMALCLDAMHFASNMVNALDLTSNFVGIVTSITGAIEFLIFALSTQLINNLFTTEDSLSQWNFLLWFTCGVQVGGTTLFLLLGDAERQAWNYIIKGVN